MFKHLTWTDRLMIEKGLRHGLTMKEIAKSIHFSERTVYYEVKRGRYDHVVGNTWEIEDRYSPDKAQARYDRNKTAKGRDLKIGNNHKLAQFIEDKIINERYSPAAVAAEIKRRESEFGITIGEKTIYNYIRKGVFLRLVSKHLPNKGKQPKRKYHRVVRAAAAPFGESIDTRPSEVDERGSFGHWEMDTVVGKAGTRPVLLVLSERLTRQEIIIPMPDKQMASTVKALDGLERRYGAKWTSMFRSITVDNGSEFFDVHGIERSVLHPGQRRTHLYFCHPYRASERGTNENTNKLIRRWLPKGTDFRKVTRAHIKKIEAWINNYPREVLGFLTSNERFSECCALI